MASESGMNRAGMEAYTESENITQAEERLQRTSNQFQNDGSFMEMFRKRMEEQSKKSAGTKAAAKPTEQQKSKEASTTSATKEPEAEATFYSPQTMYYKDDVETSSSKKPQYQVTTVLVKALV